MKFIIEKEIFEKFPELHVGVLVVKGLDNSGGNAEIMGLLKGEEERIRENFQTPTLSQNPKIEAWRKAYSSFGAKPKNYKCSVENLYRLIIEGINLRHINKLVDVYNYISIKHLVPVGGDDVEKIDGDIRLTIAKGDENFVELNSDEVKNPKEGEVVYRDDKEILCRRWNWRECDKSKMTEETKNVTLVVEGLPPWTSEEIKQVLSELQELVEKVCGGTCVQHVLSEDNSEIEV